jgi:hypothetical protein
MTDMTLTEVSAGRRCFAIAQAILAGGPVGGEAAQDLVVGWHDSGVSEQGSFAVVGLNMGLDDLIGEIVSVTYSGRTVYVYVLESADVPVQLSVCRRVFMALQRPTIEAISATVQTVQQSDGDSS